MKAELLIDSRSYLGEAAYFDDSADRVLWTDIYGKEIHLLDPADDRDTCFDVEKIVTTIVPARKGYVVGSADGVYALSEDFSVFKRMPSPDLEYSHIRCNDGKCGPDGRFWIGFVDKRYSHGTGELYVTDGVTLERALDGLDCSNGIVWNARRDTVYYTDTLKGDIYGFDYIRGKLSNRRVVFHSDRGWPDGMTIDTEDTIWAAMWGGSCVMRIDPICGKIIDTVEVDAPNVSSVAIAHKKLYITTARENLTEAQLRERPHSGSLFVANVNAVGASAYRFTGKLPE